MKNLYMICDASTSISAVETVKGYVSTCSEISFHPVDPYGEVPLLEKSDLLVLACGQIAADLLEALLLHVMEGGQLLMLAEGTSDVVAHELHMLMSARFRRAMPYGEISVETTETALTDGFTVAEFWDTPLIFERSVFDDSVTLVAMTLGQEKYPIVWHRSWYLGHVYCVASKLPSSAQKIYEPIIGNILSVMSKEV